MTKVDQFESIFRAAIRDPYKYSQVRVSSVLVVTDLKDKAATDFLGKVQGFLKTLSGASAINWELVQAPDFSGAEELLKRAEKAKPDMIVTYRNLHSTAWKHPYSLGSCLDVLIQKTVAPVLMLPHPEADHALDHAVKNTDVVMAVTDHLESDHRLVDYAVAFAEPGGELFLAHVEDDAVFNRYMAAIGKIPSIDTDDAEASIRKQLLKEPREYIDSIVKVLKERDLDIKVHAEIGFGHRLSEYREYIEGHEIDILVMRAKDEDQMAMHGMAYPLAVELRQIPLLLL